MSFWHNKRETGSPYEEADALFETAIDLSGVPERARDADRALAAAIAGYRKLVDTTKGFEAKRRLAKALWRDAALTGLIGGRHEDALVAGSEALRLGREVLQTVHVAHAAFDAIVQEVSGAMNDLAQICFAAGRPKERVHHLIEAAEVARRSAGLGGRQALGTALHNLAQHRLHAMRESTLPREWPQGDIARVLSLAERAFEVRMALHQQPGAEPYVAWELANSASQLGQLLCELANLADAAKVLRLGFASLRNSTGPTVGRLRVELAAQIAVTGERPPSAEEECWPDRTISSLSQGASVLLELLGLLEADDRVPTLVSLWFPDAWRGQAGSAPVPSFDAALAELTQYDLVTVRTCAGSGKQLEVPYLVVRVVRGRASDAKIEGFCLSVARLWADRFDADSRATNTNPVRSGVAAGVYARRARGFAGSLDILERGVLGIACRRGEGEQVLLHMQITADASEDRALVERFDLAAEKLARAHLVEGHPEEALATAAFGLDYAIRRELGAPRICSWRELRLWILYNAGRYEDLLAELDSVLRTFDNAPESHRSELARLHETVLHHGAGAAKALRRWQTAIDLNRAILESLEARGATQRDVAAQRMLDYASLLELGDSDASDALLCECEAVFDASGDHVSLAYVLGARGIVASRKGDTWAAAELKHRSLAIQYRARANPSAIAHAHDIYANELIRFAENPERATLHWLAAAVLYGLAGHRAASEATIRKVTETRRSVALRIPSTLEALTDDIAREGFSLQSVLSSTSSTRATAVLAEILESVRLS